MGSNTETDLFKSAFKCPFLPFSILSIHVGAWSDMHYCHYMFKVVKPIARRLCHVHEDLELNHSLLLPS